MINIKQIIFLYLVIFSFLKVQAIIVYLDGERDFSAEKKEALAEFRDGIRTFVLRPSQIATGMLVQNFLQYSFYTSSMKWMDIINKSYFITSTYAGVLGSLNCGWLIYWYCKHAQKFNNTELQKLTFYLKKDSLFNFVLAALFYYVAF